MADDERFFGASDPEWAVAQLAAQVAASPRHVERRSPWRVIAGVLVTTVLVAGAFVTGLTHDEDVLAGRVVRLIAEPKVTLQPVAFREVAPRTTLRPAPKPSPEQEPEPEPEVVVVDYVEAEVAPSKPSKPKRPSNQVGPNRPIKAPVDRD